jgi:hypothetical protein
MEGKLISRWHAHLSREWGFGLLIRSIKYEKAFPLAIRGSLAHVNAGLHGHRKATYGNGANQTGL